MRFKNRVALVTGAGQGIGRAIVLQLAKEGALVGVNDVVSDLCGKVAEEVRNGGGRGIALLADVSVEDEVNHMVEECVSAFGDIDILINNAGIVTSGNTEEIKVEEWDRTMAVNLRSVFICSRAVLGCMKRKGYGKIVNISSIAGEMGGVAAGADYVASKGSVLALTKKLAREWAKYNITVNALAPATTETDMVKVYSSEQRDSIMEKIPLQRLAQPEEVASAALFLASEEASFITGATLDVNGGMLMR